MRHAPRTLLTAFLALGQTMGHAVALPPASPAPQDLLDAGQQVSSIPTANSIQDFRTLDDAHVMLSLADRQQYLVTLNDGCLGLRWAEHIGVSMSGNTIWAGFDTLTADGRSCPIREIHRLPDAGAEAL